MGKKSKIYKSGLPRNQIKKLSNIKKEIARLPINNTPEVKKSSENTQKDVQIKKVPNVNYNLDTLKKVNDSLGLTEEQIKLLYTRPMRNRRFVNNLTLSRREKKRELRKMKRHLKEKMEEKTKLDITMNPNLHQRNKIMQNLIPSSKEEKQKINNNKTSIGFNFDEMNGLINDMAEEEENRINDENKNSKNSLRIKKQRNMIYNEANKINNVLNDQEFLNNPNEVMKTQIQENQKQMERNKQIRQEFNQKYNFLNLK
jgi:C4-dicarboxylate-specific signal transduction histidine kinase